MARFSEATVIQQLEKMKGRIHKLNTFAGFLPVAKSWQFYCDKHLGMAYTDWCSRDARAEGTCCELHKQLAETGDMLEAQGQKLDFIPETPCDVMSRRWIQLLELHLKAQKRALKKR